MANQITFDVESGTPVESNLTINSGANFSNLFTIKNPNGTAFRLDTGVGSTAGLAVTWTGSSQMSKSVAIGSSGPADATFAVGFTSAADGKLNISLGSTPTRNLEEGRYVYDVLVGSGATVYRVVQGSIIVKAGVSSAPS